MEGHQAPRTLSFKATPQEKEQSVAAEKGEHETKENTRIPFSLSLFFPLHRTDDLRSLLTDFIAFNHVDCRVVISFFFVGIRYQTNCTLRIVNKAYH